ncbi:MAG: FAD-binding oxidoreductase [Rhodospirillaceae bacterium]|jgi:sarcosine oxidase, subunit beta|nr:FAD-binding oxidoreductase [Rhodospirillaceae bacterium]MBT3494888.1 FAD-binding oxidoreductase [Rhodospirillaceae bacterium]MBT3781919.1 FAD-binding oxidoreductase [Rhodospirillaceae bacterium]MBT3975615.1 FAD-binding oxidoreductase [Rhodospirillaceae bacterium]MBT4168395.1 FAD-binding oxidoreductase [Rhodospirillaceae bacterium]
MANFDHIIVGGGIIGASAAYHLAREGAGSVLLLERNTLASAASSRAAGMVLQVSRNTTRTAMARQTRETIDVLVDELGADVGFHDVGSLRLAASDKCIAHLDAMAADAARHDIPFEWLDPQAAAELIPWLDPSLVRKVGFLPSDGYVDPYMLSMAYARAAAARGVEIRQGTAVTEVLTRNGRVVGVDTSAGRMESDSVIDAAGAWAALLSARVGYPLPMAPVRSHYWITKPNPTYGGDHPVITMPDVGAYARPDVGAILLGIHEPYSATFDARELPDDPAVFSPTVGEDHWDRLAEAAENIARFFPGIVEAQFPNYVAGLSTYTPDGKIILGSVPGLSGFLAASGCCGSGIVLSAGIGGTIADLALGRAPSIDIAPFRPDRFGPIDPFSVEFRDRCAASRANKSK